MNFTSSSFKNVFFGALVLAFAFSFAAGEAGAANVLTLTENSTNFTVNIGAVSQQYALNISVLYTGATTDSLWYAVDFVVPYGVNNVSACNGSSSWRVLVPYKYYGCQMNYTSAPANYTIVSINVTANISAYSDVNTTDATGIKYFWTNATSNASITITNSTPYAHNSTNYYVNPRPFVNPLGIAATYTNHTVFISNWNMTDDYYRAMLPLESFNQTLGYPLPRNDTFGELMYMNGMGPERPTFMRMSGFNLTLDFMNLSSIGSNDYYYYLIRTPVNATLHPYQTLMPLLIYNQTQTDPFDNTSFNMTMGTPAREGFSVWVGGTRYTDTALAALGVNITFSTQNQDSTGFLIVNVTNASVVNNTQVTVLLSLMNFTCVGYDCSGGMSTPLYVNWQSFEKDSQRPQFGANVSFSYYGNYSNILNNYTFQNLSLTYFLPKNVTVINNTDGTNVTFNISNGTGMYWDSNGSGLWNSTGVTTRVNCTNVTDNQPGSPMYGQSIYVCFLVYDLQLYSSYFSYWLPNASNSSVTVKVNGTLSFPTMGEETNFTSSPPGAGQSQSYEVAVSTSSRSAIDLSNKVPSIDGSTNPNYLTITVDGQPYTSSNYTLGSLYLNDLTSGSHSISVTYAVPAATSNTNSNVGGAVPTATPSPCATPTPAASTAPTTAATVAPTAAAPAFEEESESAPTSKPTSAASSVSENKARASIAGVSESIALAKTQGVNVAEAERLLALARQALNGGQYAQAEENARLAENALSVAKANANAGSKRSVAGGIDLTLVGVIVLVVLLGAAYFYFTRKNKKGL